LFIPKLKVEITSYEDDVIKGTVKHYTDHEYTQEIKYSGPVEILNSISQKVIGEVFCEEGEFEEEIKIKNRDVDWEDEGIKAQIEFGNIYVKSPEFAQTSSVYDEITINLSNTTNRFPLSDGASINNIGVYSDAYAETMPEDWIGYLRWSGDSFSTAYSDTSYATQTMSYDVIRTVNVTGRLSKNHNTLESFEGTTISKVLDDVTTTIEQSISISNLPLPNEGGSLCSNKIEGSDVGSYVTKAYYKQTKVIYTGEVKIAKTTGINFNDPEIFLTVCFANDFHGK